MERRAKVNACKELARRSGQMISMDPDRWGENMLDSMEVGLTEFLDKLPEEVRQDYEDAYIRKYCEWLSAMSRCFSQAITGAGGWKPATFRRHEKTNVAEKAALDRLNVWCEKIIKRCNRQERLTGWAEVERLQQKLDDLKELQEKMKAANKIIKSKKLAEVEKVDELVAIGFKEDHAMQLLEPPLGWWGAGFARFQLSNNNAKIRDTEAKLKRHIKMAQKENEETEYPWGIFLADYKDERYRFIFDGKPSQEVIDLMKQNAFKWSRQNMAWQRQITQNSRHAVFYIIEKLNGMFAEK